ncbi:MAG: cbb3-type cytochrome c oxidase subunit II [Acidimicrobiia bacterium]|jgi:hypothetical protein
MSEILAAAARRLGVPESIARRSAEARANATGATADEILQAWAGGEGLPASAAPQPEPAAATPTASATVETVADAEAEPAPEPAASEPAAASAPATAPPRAPASPPVLQGPRERPLLVMAGVGVLAILTVLLGVIVPAEPEPPPGALSSAIPFSEAATSGREVYLREGCASCHTQLVRAVVADAGLGPVTLSDSNQVPGIRRYGPDLAHIGSRVEDAAALGDALTGGLAGHPRYGGLSDRDLSDLVAYLVESR